MSKVLKAKVISGRYKGEIVKVTNVSADELDRKSAACFLADGRRANIPVADLEVIPETPLSEPETRKAKTASMPFVSGAASSRTMTHAKNMAKPREDKKASLQVTKCTLRKCEVCGQEYNIEERKGRPGKITECENCAAENKS